MRVLKLSDTATIPTKSHSGDLGWDLYASEDIVIGAKQSAKVLTGIAIQFPVGIGAFIKDRSSVADKKKLYTVGGVIDSGYRGELKILLDNRSYDRHVILAGTKIAQMVLIPVIDATMVEAESFEKETSRGIGGFGSTDQ